MKHVPLWTFLGSISQIMSRFNFETMCFLDDLVLRLATEYPSMVVYPFQVSYDCFKERHPNVQFERPLIRRIASAITNPCQQQFIDGLKVLNLPEVVLRDHVMEFSKQDMNSEVSQQKLKAGYDDVFNNPMRGKLHPNILVVQGYFDELFQMFGMSLCFLFFFWPNFSQAFICFFLNCRAWRCCSNQWYGQESRRQIECIGKKQKQPTRAIESAMSNVVASSLVRFDGQLHRIAGSIYGKRTTKSNHKFENCQIR